MEWDDIEREASQSVWRNFDANDLEREHGIDSVRVAYDARTPARNPLDLPGRTGPRVWQGVAAPARRFIVPEWISVGSAGLMGGQDGVGKSLLAQQLATCAAAGVPFFGIAIEQCNALYITCEDSSDELHRRQEAINEALGVTMADLDGKLHLFSLKGEIGNDLTCTGEHGELELTQRYKQLRVAAVETDARLVFVDNAAHVFPGNENDRHQVASFLSVLERLSIEIDGAVILLAHPNKQHGQGNKQGNEYSGSTGWSAHVRNRLFLDWAEGDDPDRRVLARSKANYAQKGATIDMVWQRWAFYSPDDRRADPAAEQRELIQANGLNAAFLRCLDVRNEQRRPVSEKKASRTYAPKEFADMAEAKGATARQLEQAMDRLFRSGQVEQGFLYRDTGEGKDKHGLRRASDDPPTYR